MDIIRKSRLSRRPFIVYRTPDETDLLRADYMRMDPTPHLLLHAMYGLLECFEPLIVVRLACGPEMQIMTSPAAVIAMRNGDRRWADVPRLSTDAHVLVRAREKVAGLTPKAGKKTAL